MPCAAYVGFAPTAGGAPVGAVRDTASLARALRDDPALPRPDQVLALADGVMAYFEHADRMLSFAHGFGGLATHAGHPLQGTRAGVHVAVLTNASNAQEPGLSTRTVAQSARLAAAARPGQVLASREFHTLITRILRFDNAHFKLLTLDTSGAPIGQVFEILPAGAAAQGAIAITDVYLTAIEQALAQEIGPMARILVRQAREASFDRADLARRLAKHVSDPARRAAFERHFVGDTR
jgi:hypothetical protein